MRSIARRYKNIEKKYIELPSFICFGRAIRGQRFTQKVLRRHFNDLVDKNEYDKSDKRQLFNHFYRLNETG